MGRYRSGRTRQACHGQRQTTRAGIAFGQAPRRSAASQAGETFLKRGVAGLSIDLHANSSNRSGARLGLQAGTTGDETQLQPAR